MRCDFCGEEIEGQPFFKEGMGFCSLECSDAMEGGETMPLGEEVLNDPEDSDDEDELKDDEEDKDGLDIGLDNHLDDDLLEDESSH